MADSFNSWTLLSTLKASCYVWLILPLFYLFQGKYTCTDKCPSYGALPAGCKMVSDFANPCCQKPTCDFSGNYGEITGTLTPSPAPGQTNAPGLSPTGAPTASKSLLLLSFLFRDNNNSRVLDSNPIQIWPLKDVCFMFPLKDGAIFVQIVLNLILIGCIETQH